MCPRGCERSREEVFSGSEPGNSGRRQKEGECSSEEIVGLLADCHAYVMSSMLGIEGRDARSLHSTVQPWMGIAMR